MLRTVFCDCSIYLFVIMNYILHVLIDSTININFGRTLANTCCTFKLLAAACLYVISIKCSMS